MSNEDEWFVHNVHSHPFDIEAHHIYRHFALASCANISCVMLYKCTHRDRLGLLIDRRSSY